MSNLVTQAYNHTEIMDDIPENTSKNALKNYEKHIHKTSRLKTCRLPKKEYLEKTSQKNKSMHKKREGPPMPELVYSKDIEGNRVCAACKTLIISKDITNNDEIEEIINKFER